MKSFLSTLSILVLAATAAAECNDHVYNRHARAQRAHRRQVVPRAQTATTVDVDTVTTTAATDAANTAKFSLPAPAEGAGTSAVVSSVTDQSQPSQKRDNTSASASASSAPDVHTDTGATSLLAAFKAPTVAFPDGVYDCSQFPSDQEGVVAVDYLGFGGWSGIQYSNGGSAVAGMSCTEGAYCSYACQPGMSKTQWPASQPANGESHGGLLCQNGKLYRTNSASEYLCEWGMDASYVVNQLAQPVAICRTDYPGTENMVVPTVVQGNGTEPLTVVDEDSYYKWQGKLTSAQYYVNKAGGSASSDCLWGTSADDFGNWAPVNFGAGYTDGVAWLSIMYNPLTSAKLDYNVKIECASGNMNGECAYENGAIVQGGNGCTVSCNGVCHFVLY